MSFNKLKNIIKQVEAIEKRAAMRAINRSLAKANTSMRRRLSKETGLKAADLSKRFFLKKAQLKMLEAFLSFGTRFGVKLHKLKAKAKSVKVAKRRYQGVTIKMGPEARTLVTGAFFGKVAAGVIVFARKAASRLPLLSLTKDLYEYALRSRQAIQKELNDDLKVQLEKQLQYEMSKLNK